MATSQKKSPIAKYQQGTLQIAVWSNDNGNSYTISKSFKKKDKDGVQSNDWTTQKISIFDAEILILEDMIAKIKVDRIDNFKNN